MRESTIWFGLGKLSGITRITQKFFQQNTVTWLQNKVIKTNSI